MKPAIVLYKRIPEDLRQRLDAHFEVRFFDGINDANRSAVQAALQDARGMIGASAPVRAGLLDCAPQLQAISTISVGVDQFDPDDLTRRGILLMHTPTVLTETTADTIFMLLMMTARRAGELAEWVKAGHWKRSIDATMYGVDVHHKTIGIIGMGRIGAALARRAHGGFAMRVLYVNETANQQVEQQYDARRCSLDELLAQSDFVCLTLPLTPQTEKMIDARRLAQMKPGAILVNGARGKIVNQQDLIDALKKEIIRGAGLDVFEQEPLPADSELLRLPGVVALPHIGSATHETRYNMAACAVDNLITALTGTVTHNGYNLHQLTQR
ncbi:NAD(P)-dependent oxidoreductase [Entomohabitans teleogrylli]|uniref:NAD(P)-dependent oxidoreductase n=1 Tax=Entomohabitans teleogrylli TaxID=1384589 RepID=UPI00073D999B|nr:NAD(P)-dependent oxidoreductase [Entomohabitans teleogrylli]